MANEDAQHRCVTRFMLDTCRPTSEYAEVEFLLPCVARIAVGDDEVFMSGSSAELRFTPMIPSIGDFDVMYVEANVIAIPHGHTPPTKLADNYERIVYVFEIIDSHQPGFVYLRNSHRLTKRENGHYVAEKIENDESTYLKRLLVEHSLLLSFLQEGFQRYVNDALITNRSKQLLWARGFVAEPHGPATKLQRNYDIFSDIYKPTDHLSGLSVDFVRCIHCLLWPILAANWPTRNREHGWPDQTTANVIVSNGCDLVAAVHPLCRQDEWMNEYQWRLSFSRAEVTLLNSWTKVQQIIYHMLRYVSKLGGLSKTDDNDRNLPQLSNYHIKTLMLWECEQKPRTWWSAESSVIKLCSSLLRKLSDWVKHKHCQHYFISNCNILDYFVEDVSMMVSNSLRILANESILLTWFIENYIRRCALYCPDDVSVLFENICSSDKLERAVDAAVDWKLNTLSQDICADHYKSEIMIIGVVAFVRTDAKATKMFMKELQNFDPRLRDYFVAVISLRVAYTISMNSATEDLLEILWTLLETRTAAASDIRKYESGEFLCIQRAIHLATLSTVRSTAVEMLHNEMSKAFLHHSFAYAQQSAYCLSLIHI